jgi:hypothetical protein
MISFNKFTILCYGFISSGLLCISLLFTDMILQIGFYPRLLGTDDRMIMVIVPLTMVFFICGGLFISGVVGKEKKNIINTSDGWIATNDNP